MEKVKKNLREFSWLIIALGGLAIIRNIIDMVRKGFHVDQVPEGMTEGMAMIGVIITYILAFVLLIPQFYVGVKGLKIVKEPDSSKAHIIWAIILAVFAGIGAITAISGLAGGKDMVDGILTISNLVLDVAIYVAYISCAKQIAKQAPSSEE